MHIRQLTEEDDLVALTALIHRAYAPLAAKGLRYWATHQTVQDTAERCRSGVTWVAEINGVVRGTITLSEPTRVTGSPWYDRPDVAKFSQFCVEPSTQGSGVGASLMDHVEQHAPQMGAKSLACDTSEQAERLIHMYARRGYRFIEHVDWRPEVNYRSVILSLAVGWSMRPADESDVDFIHGLRRANYRPYVEQYYGGWDEAWQYSRFTDSWQKRGSQVLARDGQDIGYIDAEWGNHEVNLRNIVLAPAAQGEGLGSAVLADFLRRADGMGLRVRLQVFESNPAVRLYERLGFEVTEADAKYVKMVRPRPDRPDQS